MSRMGYAVRARDVAAAVILGAGLVGGLSGCAGSEEPSQPPTSEGSLTTAGADAGAATSAAPADDVATTSATAAGDAGSATSEGPEAGGKDKAPKMPAAAKEQSEAGAEAFVGYYVDTLNYAHRTGRVGVLKQLSGDGCKACAALEKTAQKEPAGGDYIRLISASGHASSPVTTVRAVIEQIGGDTGNLLFDLAPSKSGTWQVREIQVETGT